MNQFFDVNLSIDVDDGKWIASFKDVNIKDNIGCIEGNMRRNKKTGIKIFEIDNSDLTDPYRGKGIGLFMYESVIKKILNIFPNAEFRSSTNLNEFSKGTWKCMVKKYYNVEEMTSQFVVSRKKEML